MWRIYPSFNTVIQSLWFLTRKLLTQGYLSVCWSHQFDHLSRHHDLVKRYGILSTNHHGYVLFDVITIRSLRHTLLFIGFVTWCPRWVQQGTGTFPENMSSPSPVVCGGLSCSIFSLLCNFCTSVFPLHCLSFRFMASGYPFGIFKLFLYL